ncbi:hypothetical protein [Sulfobacillus thermosulfidooxidans]|jgi:hypothetical protein|uniref:hypothetical protein n=1 Tax=Sulfobacillus thermosulfidooxidans TaxID=28034 RepID=UPI0003109667|nr:hypothetical protein [Sulfobacillus thermosulfidooxidans]
MASHSLLPLDHKPMTRRDAADCLRGLAEWIESYPTEGILLTLDVEAIVTQAASSPKPRRKSAAR